MLHLLRYCQRCCQFRLIPLGVFSVILLLGCNGGKDVNSLSFMQQHSKTIPPGMDFSLLDQLGGYHQLSRYRNTKAIVLVSIDPHCSDSAEGLNQVQKLHQTYSPKTIKVLMLNASEGAQRLLTQEWATTQALDIPIIMDPTQFVAYSLGIKTGAEIVVIDPKNWQVVFHGPLQTGFSELEIQLEALIAGTEVTPKSLAAVQCPIKFDSSYRNTTSPTYTQKIAGILQKRCLNCHSEGGVAPWAMTDYNTVKNWALMMSEAVKTGRMPPWQADDPEREIANNISLTDEEKRDLLLWLNNGTPRGEGTDPLVNAAKQLVKVADDWVLGEPDRIFRTEVHSIPATGVLPYKYEFIALENAQARYVKAVHLRPLNKKVVHHSFMFVVPPQEYQESLENPLSNDWKSGAFATFAPGVFGEINPDNVVRYIPANSKLKFEIHYTPTGKEELGGVEVGLYFTEPKPNDRHYRMEGVYNQWFRLPAGWDDWPVKASKVFTENIVLYELMPHMHYRGKTMRYTLISPGGQRQEILSVPRFDFNWQRQYRLRKPLRIAAGSQILVEGSFDNSTANPYNPDPTIAVGFGEQTTDEMFIGYITYTIED